MGRQVDFNLNTPLQLSDGEMTSGSLPVVPGYRMVHHLGSGGQGRVFQAIRLANNTRVALKLIHRDRIGDARARARFEQASDVLARLDHPNIVRAIERGELATGELWLATQYIPGVRTPRGAYRYRPTSGAAKGATLFNRPTAPPSTALFNSRSHLHRLRSRSGIFGLKNSSVVWSHARINCCCVCTVGRISGS
ncbi:MAG: hypothetical protein HZA51_12290 [Planctomycetes bacterium]|nr:hypothetical protein [Planctomycetota bacterium]